jgi:hypothetical protein
MNVHGYDYYDSDGEGHYINENDQSVDDTDDEEEWIESESLRRRNIISELHASSLQDLDLSDDIWASSVTMESFQPDLENMILELQSNRSLITIRISREFLAAIAETDQGRLFRSLGNFPTLQHMTIYGGAELPSAIHTRVLDALSETSNSMRSLRSEVDQLARGLKARVGSLEVLW